MRLPGNIRVTQGLRRLRSRLRPGIAILGYHRVDAGTADPLRLSIDPRRFEAHLEVLARMARPMRLVDAAAALRAGRVPPGAVVLTFDDGYADNLHTVLPLLERYQMPATMFVTSGNRGGEFWWDRLARMRLSEAGHSIDATSMALESMSETEREDALRRLERTCGYAAEEPLYRALTTEELERLAGGALVEIGAHTVSHAPLTRLMAADQRRELHQSRQALEALLGVPVTSFAYPHGAATPETASFVQAAGYAIACCSRADVAIPGSAPFMLPRLWPDKRDGHEFERWLRGWLHAA